MSLAAVVSITQADLYFFLNLEQNCIFSAPKNPVDLRVLMLMQGFEEIHVPALKPKPFAKDERIVKIKDLPAWMHPAFDGMKELNRIQSRVRQ